MNSRDRKGPYCEDISSDSSQRKPVRKFGIPRNGKHGWGQYHKKNCSP